MPREIVTLQVGQCGNQIGWRFWDLLLREHSMHSPPGMYDEGMSTFFANVDGGSGSGEGDSGRAGPLVGKARPKGTSLADGPIPRKSLRARAVLIDMEEGVVNQILRSPIGDLFERNQLITDVSGAGNNWAHGYSMYGPHYRESILDQVRRSLEACESPQSFFMLHSTGGGTGSGVGSYVLEQLADAYPELYRFTASVFPSDDDDVVVSPYNLMLSLGKLIEYSDCVLPLENQALLDVVGSAEKQISKAYMDKRSVQQMINSSLTYVHPPPISAARMVWGRQDLVSQEDRNWLAEEAAAMAAAAAGAGEKKGGMGALIAAGKGVAGQAVKTAGQEAVSRGTAAAPSGGGVAAAAAAGDTPVDLQASPLLRDSLSAAEATLAKAQEIADSQPAALAVNAASKAAAAALQPGAAKGAIGRLAGAAAATASSSLAQGKAAVGGPGAAGLAPRGGAAAASKQQRLTAAAGTGVASLLKAGASASTGDAAAAGVGAGAALSGRLGVSSKPAARGIVPGLSGGAAGGGSGARAGSAGASRPSSAAAGAGGTAAGGSSRPGTAASRANAGVGGGGGGGRGGAMAATSAPISSGIRRPGLGPPKQPVLVGILPTLSPTASTPRKQTGRRAASLSSPTAGAGRGSAVSALLSDGGAEGEETLSAAPAGAAASFSRRQQEQLTAPVSPLLETPSRGTAARGPGSLAASTSSIGNAAGSVVLTAAELAEIKAAARGERESAAASLEGAGAGAATGAEKRGKARAGAGGIAAERRLQRGGGGRDDDEEDESGDDEESRRRQRAGGGAAAVRNGSSRGGGGGGGGGDEDSSSLSGVSSSPLKLRRKGTVFDSMNNIAAHLVRDQGGGRGSRRTEGGVGADERERKASKRSLHVLPLLV